MRPLISARCRTEPVPLVVLVAALALGGCTPASSSDSGVWPDYGTYCHRGRGADAVRPDAWCGPGLDGRPDVAVPVFLDAGSVDAEAGPDICPLNPTPNHCDPGPVTDWCVCSSVWTLGIKYLPCGIVHCDPRKSKDCQQGCLFLPGGGGICREEVAEECLTWSAGPTSIRATRDGQAIDETLVVEGTLGKIAEGSFAIAAPGGETTFHITTPATWTLGLPAGSTVQAHLHCCDSRGEPDGLLVFDANHGLRLALGTPAASRVPELLISIDFGSDPDCPGPVLRVGLQTTRIPLGAYRDLPTLWGVRRIWNTSTPDVPALARSFAITLYCQVK
jgi:hypothetical protein